MTPAGLTTVGNTRGCPTRSRWCCTQTAIREAAADSGPRTIAVLHNNLGQVLKEQGDYAAALTRFKTGLKMYEAALEPGHGSIATLHNIIAMVLLAQGDFAGALSRHKTCLRMREATLEPGHPTLQAATPTLGRCSWRKAITRGPWGRWR